MSSLSIAVSALRSHAQSIDVTSHNIANAATEGYRRERIDLKAQSARHPVYGAIGTGVGIAGLSQATDRLADERVRRSGAQLGFYTTRAQVGSLAEDVFGEPDNGVTVALDTLFDSFSSLATAPTDSAARAQVLSALQNFGGRVNDVFAGLEGLEADVNSRLRAQVDEINSLAARVAQINTFARTPGGLPAPLNDELQSTLDQLADLAGATADTQPDGRVRVTVNGWALVDADRSIPLEVPDDPLGTVLHPSGEIALGGSAGGLQVAITGDIADFRTRLDDFVGQFVTDVNDLHASGFTPDGTPGGPLLSFTDSRITVEVTDNSELAASDDDQSPVGAEIADALAQLRTASGGQFRDVVTSVSNQIASLERSASTAGAVSDSAVAVRDSVIGVNLDEEMTNLIAQQRAYEAAARVISVSDEMLQTLLAM